MRDRRNTNLSTSSTGSTQSSPPTTYASPNEKRYSSPPPDDGLLPLPVTKENKPRFASRRAIAVRAVVAFCALLLFTRCFVAWPSTEWTPSVFDHAETTDAAEQFEGGNELPENPTALIVNDKAGHQRWTVSIPSNASFPLRPGQYQDICTQSEVLSSGLRQTSRLSKVKSWRAGSYTAKDPNYLDVAGAQRTGVLPTSPSTSNDSFCDSSLTFSMETTDASFGKTLMLLWLSYGLAKNENRAFFIDDSNWPYGKYTSYFLSPPAPSCTRPPPSHIVPCPHTAAHLVVSAATAPWTFGPAFQRAHSPLRSHGMRAAHSVHALARAGYEALFHLAPEDAAYVQARSTALHHPSTPSPVIGLHIRRGDLHPFSPEFSADYLPLETYTSASPNAASFLLASDDPALLSTPEFTLAAAPVPVSVAQDRIQLATKAALDASSPAQSLREPGSAYTKHVDENAGWDGGFYSSLFYALGESNPYHPAAVSGEGVSESTMRLRELVGRGYLLDLAVLGSADGVVCGVSSAACRVLGVMIGWEGVLDGKWKNVDGGRSWSWDGRRR